MSEHTVPLHCPYCAGESLHPHGATAGTWECRECCRVFAVKFCGLLARATSLDSHETRTTEGVSS